MRDGATFLNIYIIYSLPVLTFSKGHGGGSHGGGSRGGGRRFGSRRYYGGGGFSGSSSYGSGGTESNYVLCTFESSTPEPFTNHSVENKILCEYGCCRTVCCPWYINTATIVSVIFLFLFVTGIVFYACKKCWKGKLKTICTKYLEKQGMSGTDDVTTPIVPKSSKDSHSYVNETLSDVEE